jgi:hypothetical protein
MITDEEDATPGISSQSVNTEGPDSTAITGENIADGLSALKRDSFQSNAIETPQQETSKPTFVLPHWHKAYAEALLCADSESLPLILWAEMEIRARYLTAFACPIEPDESRDLQRASLVLSQLNKHKAAVA